MSGGSSNWFWPILFILWTLAGCSRGEAAPKRTPAPRPGASSTEGAERLEVVRRADDLALEASRAKGPEAARLRYEAASLRARLWRTTGKEADALEASELYAASVEGWEGACDATVERALFEGERRAVPTEAYLALYRAKRRFEDADCVERIDAALSTLVAFSPPPAVLAAIDEGAATAPAAVQPVESKTQEDSTVVLPDIDSAPQEPVEITRIEHYSSKDSARVVVFVTHPTVFDLGMLAGSAERGPRLFVDIRHAKYSGSRAIAGEGLVDGVRVGKRQGGTRVVLDLAAPVEKRVFYLPEPFRLVMDVSRQGAKPEPEPADGKRSVERIVIDPGHGGHDPGATGLGGLREKDVALDIAHRAAPLIARELGISTLLTRDADVFVPLDERVARANAFGADLFISIHCNASENHDTSGITTFVLDASRDALAAKVAARENAASQEAAVELANALSRVLDADTAAHSSHFAKLLQRSAMSSVVPRYPGCDDLGVRSAGFYVLAGARMPAVLFETSFISHELEERRLDSPDYRQKLADAIVNAVRAFREGV